MKAIFPIVVCLFLSKLLEAQSDSVTYTFNLHEDTLRKAEFYNRGLSFYQSDSFSQAILSFDSCLLLDSSFTNARFMKALSLEKHGDLKEALSEFERIKRDDAGYEDVDKRIKNYYLIVYLSKNWYYMLAMLFVVIIFMVIVARFIPHKKW